MLFNSFSFLIFFPLVTILYFSIKHQYRWPFLLIASSIFYMVFIPAYILILLLTITIDYWAGIKIEETEGKTKKLFLVGSIFSTCLVLIIFKYCNFFNANFSLIADFFKWHYPIAIVNVILPIGLSFHTFQSLSYVIEVYFRRQRAERNFGIYSLYVMFYPQLVAGPIERPGNLLHQFYEKHYFDYERVTEGLRRMLWGFFKKMVIADNLALYVNLVFARPADYSGSALLLVTFFFAIQIYCDFSGYADIAIGAAEVMGFKLMENFKNPYFATSIRDFWSRWHISLSTWFRDYVYIPLGGNRVSKIRWSFNILSVFLLSGLWHGANWTYVVWGGVHGVFSIISHLFGKVTKKFAPWFHNSSSFIVVNIKRLSVFVVVSAAWVFFRAQTLSDAFYIFGKEFSGIKEIWSAGISSLLTRSIQPLFIISQQLIIINNSGRRVMFCFTLIFILFIAEVIDARTGLMKTVATWHPWIRFLVYVALVISVMNIGVTKEIPFIYFQF